MDYYNATYNLSIEECDKIALLEGGKLGERGYTYECNPKCGPINNEWGVSTIGTRGMGNYGTDVLRPLTPRARAIAREGRIRALVSAGVRRRTAEVAAIRKYGMEVAGLADDLVEIAALGVDIGPSRRSFERATGIDTGPWSIPRVWAAWAIACEVAGER